MVKAVLVGVLIAIAVLFLVAGVVSMDDGTSVGVNAIRMFKLGGQDVTSNPTAFSPWTVVTDWAWRFLPAEADYAPSWVILTGVFGATVVFVAGLYVMKLAFRILGG